MGYGISTTVEHDHLIFLQNFSSRDYFFLYDSDDNNVVGLIHPNPEITDTTYSEIQDEDVVDTMGYDMLEAM